VESASAAARMSRPVKVDLQQRAGLPHVSTTGSGSGFTGPAPGQGERAIECAGSSVPSPGSTPYKSLQLTEQAPKSLELLVEHHDQCGPGLTGSSGGTGEKHTHTHTHTHTHDRIRICKGVRGYLPSLISRTPCEAWRAMRVQVSQGAQEAGERETHVRSDPHLRRTSARIGLLISNSL
jgi:hypothetical protein